MLVYKRTDPQAPSAHTLSDYPSNAVLIADMPQWPGLRTGRPFSVAFAVHMLVIAMCFWHDTGVGYGMLAVFLPGISRRRCVAMLQNGLLEEVADISIFLAANPMAPATCRT